jgi:conjugative relaxase-like TrwC/TraI family protein
VLRFKTFASARAAIRYYVEHGADCARTHTPASPDPPSLDPTAEGAGRAVDYYNEHGRVLGRWAGAGAAALGLAGPILPGQVEVLSRLLSGQLPDGTQIATPVWRPHPDSRLPIGPFLDAVHLIAVDRGVPVEDVVSDPKARAELSRLSARLAADPTAVAKLEPLEKVATGAGIDLGQLYGPGRVAVAHAQSDVKVDARRAGADGAISAPKTVSLLWAFGDPAISEQVLAAHRTAVTETVKHLEKFAGHGLRGHQGDGHRAAQVGTDGLIVAGFEHLTSRADDPQIHTHLVIANLTHGNDGRWTALDTRALFRHQRTAGYLYQAVLRGELTTRLGIAWGPVRNGMAEITGIPEPLRREFSTRRAQIDAHLQATGGHGVAAAQVACLATRPAKSGRTVNELLPGWWARAIRHVPAPARMIRAVLHRQHATPLDPATLTRITDRLLGPDGVTARRSSADRRDLTQALLEAAPAGTPVGHEQVEGAIDRLLTDRRVLPLLTGDDERRWTTVELAHTELATLQLAATTSAVPAAEPTMPPGLSARQRVAVQRIAASTSSVDVVLGPAGAGKTAMLTALHSHYQALGVPVLGACIAAVTARRLEHATAIPATSIARLTNRLGDGQPLPDRCVLVIDEAGMVGTRDYHQLLHAVTAAGGKLIPVGDRAQLTEIDAGGMFAQLSRTYLRVELTDNHRQRHGWERAALTTLRAGDIPRALNLYQRYDRLHPHADTEQLVTKIASQYIAAVNNGTAPGEVVALTATRRDAARLNHAIRQQLQDVGAIGPDQTAGGDSYAVGELVMVTRNDHGRGLLNGQRATVTAVQPKQVSLDIEGQAVTVPADWANDRLTGAYALTIHKAQGLTVDVALVDATGIPDRNAGYVALSRARDRTEIHHTGADQLADALGDDPLSPIPARDPLQRGITADLAQRLTRTSEHQLAIDQRPSSREMAGRDLGRSG